ncbi:4Fe-4S binding protein [Thermosulfurimonas sp. F29]|nr:4Fe-4S binding protein [Thermosulfurimonas sp. F29]
MQFLIAVWVNSYLGFLLKGGIYTGRLKNICFPGLNCYSCPAALMACPLGILQHVMATLRTLPEVAVRGGLYLLGSLLFYGLLLGRFVCGWICPFGFIQEMFYRLPLPKISLPRRARVLKWGLFFILVLGLPFLHKGATGYGEVWFCRIFCPAGTLEAGVPSLLLVPQLRALIGFIFYWKVLVLTLIVVGSVLHLRFFCKIFCPLGLIYGIFNKLSLFRLRWEEDSCIFCGICENVCPMELKIPGEINSGECIRCLNCLSSCPTHSISLKASFRLETGLDLMPLSVAEKRHASRRKDS